MHRLIDPLDFCPVSLHHTLTTSSLAAQPWTETKRASLTGKRAWPRPLQKTESSYRYSNSGVILPPFSTPASTLITFQNSDFFLPSSSLCGCPQYSLKPNFNCTALLETYQELCQLPGVPNPPPHPSRGPVDFGAEEKQLPELPEPQSTL